MTRNSGVRNIASAVRETLDSIVSPSVRDTILSRALAEAHLPELPAEPSSFDTFVRGALHDELVRSLGPELGSSVADELERIGTIAQRDAKARDKGARPDARNETVRPGRGAAAPAVSMPSKRRLSRSTLPSRELPPNSGRDPNWTEQQRRGVAPTLPAAPSIGSREPAAPTNRDVRPGMLSAQPVSADFPAGTAKALGVIGTVSIDPRSGSRPVVYVASANDELVRSFQNWLGARAHVVAVTSTKALLQALGEPTEKRSVVVLDGKNPSIRPLTLAALADEFPAGTAVLLWGVASHVHARMCTVSAATEKWLVASGTTSPNDVVARCAKIVG